jgi:SAM-dependent methyltransferase
MFGAAPTNRERTPQEKVTAEWEAMAGEWDDMASGYANGFYKLLWQTTGLDPSDSNGTTPAIGTVLDFGCGTGILADKLRLVSKKVVALDASPAMIAILQEKIKSMEWENVDAAVAVLATADDDTKAATTRRTLEGLEGTVDLIVASSVMSFVPEADLEATMRGLGRLLKPGGLFCHSDWPKSQEQFPDGFDEAKAENMYAMGGLSAKTLKIMPLDTGGEKMEVFIGVAEKSLET